MLTSKWWRLGIAGSIGVVGIVGWVLVSPTPPILPSGSTGVWTAEGSFSEVGAEESDRDMVGGDAIVRQGLRAFVSGTGRSSEWGTLVSKPFVAPESLGLFVAGHPNREHIDLALENAESGERFDFTGSLGSLGKTWVPYSFDLPEEWVGSQVRIRVTDRSFAEDGWVGISSPFGSDWRHAVLNQLLPLLLVVAWHGMFFLAVLLAGVPVALFLVRRRSLPPLYTLPLALTVCSLLGYIGFFFHLIGHAAGASYAWVTLAGSLLLLLVGARKGGYANELSHSDFLIPLSLMYLVSLLYFSIPGWQFDETSFALSGRRQGTLRFLDFIFFGPIDHVLPAMFANAVQEGTEREIIPKIGSWKFSDRPPLQAGLVLHFDHLFSARHFYTQYHLLGTILQCFWVPALWLLCRVSRMPGRSIVVIAASCIYSGFFYFNSVYVWPKFLAASLVIFAYSCVMRAHLESRPPSSQELIFIGSTSGLAMLGHGGVVFTIVPMFLLLLRPAAFPPLRSSAAGAACFLTLVLSWMAYQEFHDPRIGGDILVKIHLAGFIGSFTDRTPPLQTIIDAYRNLTLPEFFALKRANLEAIGLLGEQSFLYERRALFGELLSDPKSWYSFRSVQFTSVFAALGSLKLGLLVFLFLRFSRDRDSPVVKAGTHVAWIVLLNLAIWILLMFGGLNSRTVLFQGSYALMILMFFLAGSSISVLPTVWVGLVLAYNTVLFGVFWVYHPWKQFASKIAGASAPSAFFPQANIAMVGLSALLVLCTIALFYRIGRGLGRDPSPRYDAITPPVGGTPHGEDLRTRNGPES